jgi:hypothetical protein
MKTRPRRGVRVTEPMLRALIARHTLEPCGQGVHKAFVVRIDGHEVGRVSTVQKPGQLYPWKSYYAERYLGEDYSVDHTRAVAEVLVEHLLAQHSPAIL